MSQMSVQNYIRSVCLMLYSEEEAVIFYLLKIVHVIICVLGCQLNLQV